MNRRHDDGPRYAILMTFPSGRQSYQTFSNPTEAKSYCADAKMLPGVTCEYLGLEEKKWIGALRNGRFDQTGIAGQENL